MKDLQATGGMTSSQQLFRSEDGGQTWVLLAQNGFENVLTQPRANFGVFPSHKASIFFFLTAELGWIGTNEAGPTVYYSRDGGNTWTPASIPNPTTTKAIDCTDTETCTVTMTLATWTTADGGTTWTRLK